jgi:hypothetical protein
MSFLEEKKDRLNSLKLVGYNLIKKQIEHRGILMLVYHHQLKEERTGTYLHRIYR